MKKISNNDLDKIIKEINALIIQGFSANYKCLNKEPIGNALIASVKFRVSSLNKQKGRSGGYRIIGLVDYTNKLYMILHVYEKNKKRI